MGNSSAELRAITQKVIASEQITVATPGTAVHPTSNVDAVYVRVMNNTANKVVCGMQDAEVDAIVSPIKGFVLNTYDSRVFAVVNDAAEVFVDADIAGTKASIEILGRD